MIGFWCQISYFVYFGHGSLTTIQVNIAPNSFSTLCKIMLWNFGSCRFLPYRIVKICHFCPFSDARFDGCSPCGVWGGESFRPGHSVCHFSAVRIHPLTHPVRERHRLHLPPLEVNLQGRGGRQVSHVRHRSIQIQVSSHRQLYLLSY